MTLIFLSAVTFQLSAKAAYVALADTTTDLYVSPTGSGTLCTSANPCLLSYAEQIAVPGNTAYLNPGNYGSFTFGRQYGEPGNYVRFMANPATVTPRDANWYEGDIDNPNPAIHPIFSGIMFGDVESGGRALGHFMELNGIYVENGNIDFDAYVADVIIRNCSIFGQWGDTTYDVTGTAIHIYQQLTSNSDFRNILVENCYSEYTASGFDLYGNFGNVTARNNHFHSFEGTGMSITNMDGGGVVFEGNHIEHQIVLPDTLSTQSDSYIESVSPDLTRIYLTNTVNTYDYIEVINPSGGRYFAEIENIHQPTSEVILKEPLPFIPDIGSQVWFWDGSHGSCIALRENTNVKIIGNKIHECGGSQGIGLYESGLPYENITFANNLFYSSLHRSSYGLKFNSLSSVGFGDGCVIENNTLVGFKISSNLNQYYGIPAALQLYNNQLKVRNNIFVGWVQGDAFTSDMEVQDNIIYYDGSGTSFETDSVGPNRDNIEYYPNPVFDGSGNFFVGGPYFDQYAYTHNHYYNLNDNFRPVIGSSACSNGIITQGHLIGEPCAGATPTVLYGDVSGNGTVSSSDAALVARYVVGLETFTDEQKTKADVSGNGSISSTDAALIAQRAVGLIDKFPVENQP